MRSKSLFFRLTFERSRSFFAELTNFGNLAPKMLKRKFLAAKPWALNSKLRSLLFEESIFVGLAFLGLDCGFDFGASLVCELALVRKRFIIFAGGCVWLMLPYTGSVLMGFLRLHRICAGEILSC